MAALLWHNPKWTSALLERAFAKRYTLLFLLFALLLSTAGIVLKMNGFFPLGGATFGVLSVLLLLATLFRPGYAFLFLVVALPLETISLAPEWFPIGLRPYQWLFAALLVALLVRFASARHRFALPKLSYPEILLFVMALGAVVSALFSEAAAESFRLALIFATLVLLSLSFRLFVKDVAHISRLVPYVLLALSLTALFSIMENILFELGRGVSVMPGRPNALFPEPDWLGGYLGLGVAALLPILFHAVVVRSRIRAFCASGTLFLTLVALVLTVSRSAWLALGAVLVIFSLAAVLLFRRAGAFRAGIFLSGAFAALIAAAFLFVSLTGLSRFPLLERAASSVSGEQVITLACQGAVTIPDSVGTGALPDGCLHIDLEAIAEYEAHGYHIATTKRSDPNAVTRFALFERALTVLRERPLQGSGLGGGAAIFGVDQNGVRYNASNIFLDIWLGTGLIGFVSFLALWGVIGFQSFREVFLRRESERFFVGLFLLLGWVTLTVFNVFNTMLLLSVWWAYLGVALVFLERPKEEGVNSNPI